MKRIVAVSLLLLLSACVGTQDRPMNYSEDTYLSRDVEKMLAESETGTIDTRDHPEVKCRRFKRVGTHMVTRHCYTVAEADESERKNQDELRERFGQQRCLDLTVGGPCIGR